MLVAQSALILTDHQRPPSEPGIFVPQGFPKKIISPMVWSGQNLKDEKEWLWIVSDDDKRELDSALAHFKGLGVDGDLLDESNFPLPKLREKLHAIRKEIHEGKGFGLLRGLNPEDYSKEDMMLIYLGVQSHIADLRGRQDDAGNMLAHIIANASSPARALHTRHSRAATPFHNDTSCDIIALQTRSNASEGGECLISSAYQIYNDLAATNPSVLHVLTRPDWPYDPFTPDHSYRRQAILFNHEGRIVINFCPGHLVGTLSQPRSPKIPSLSPEQEEALRIVQGLAIKHQFEFIPKPGDIHFLNNLSLLHSRAPFQNSDQTQRHMVRLWLRNSKAGWSIPPAMQTEWDRAFSDSPNLDRVWHIDPMPDRYFPLWNRPN